MTKESNGICDECHVREAVFFHGDYQLCRECEDGLDHQYDEE